MLLIDKLVEEYTEAVRLGLASQEGLVTQIEDELYIIAAETGMDREACYCSEQHFEDTLNNAGFFTQTGEG